MSKKIEVKVNYGAVGDLLHSNGMSDVMINAGRQIQRNAGDGYEVIQKPERVIVCTEGDQAALDNLEHNTLLKAVR